MANLPSKNRSFYARYAWFIMLVAVVLVGPICIGVERAFRDMNNNIRQWLPNMPETEHYKDFRRVFGADDIAVISWEGCTLDDERLERLVEALSREPPQEGDSGVEDKMEDKMEDKAEDKTRFFQKVATGPQAVRTLMDEPFVLSHRSAVARLKGILIGHDGKTTCAVVTLSEIGDADRHGAVDALKEIAIEACGLEPDQLKLSGDAVINAAIDIESEKADRWIGLSALVGLAVAWLSLRRIRLMLMIFFVSAYAMGLGTAAIHFTGGRMNLVMVLVPVLIYVLTLSASVHLVNYYRDTVRKSGVEGAPLRAVKVGWLPCFLASLTTALGVASLCVSRVVPVKQFGFYSALGVLLSLVSLFVLLPTLMELFPLREAKEKPPSKKDPQKRVERVLDRVAGGIIRYRRPVALVCFLFLVFCGTGVTFIQTSVRPLKFFPPDSKWRQDMAWLFDNIGSVIAIEVLLHVDEDNEMSFLQRMELAQLVELEIRGMEDISGSLSAATFAPPLGSVRVDESEPVSTRVLIERGVLNKRLASNRDVFEEAGYVAKDGHQDLWRVTARAVAREGMDYDQIEERVKKRVDKLLEKIGKDKEIKVVYTGGVPLVFTAQRQLLKDLYTSFCMAFVLIAIVMMILLRSVWAGVIVMLPNVFPALVTFGIMGWTHTLVDVGSMMTASVALGIAVDDTLHFLTWFRRAALEGKTRVQAIGVAYRRCAVAMTQTTLIAGLANVVFVMCDFQPVARYGLLMFILLVAALVGDLIFLPAILATRVGKLFVRGRPSIAENNSTVSSNDLLRQ